MNIYDSFLQALPALGFFSLYAVSMASTLFAVFKGGAR